MWGIRAVTEGSKHICPSNSRAMDSGKVWDALILQNISGPTTTTQNRGRSSSHKHNLHLFSCLAHNISLCLSLVTLGERRCCRCHSTFETSKVVLPRQVLQSWPITSKYHSTCIIRSLRTRRMTEKAKCVSYFRKFGPLNTSSATRRRWHNLSTSTEFRAQIFGDQARLPALRAHAIERLR